MEYKKEESKFVTRFASLIKDREALKVLNEEQEFKDGYKKGSLHYAVASNHLTLTNCGLDRYVEAATNCIWKRDGDNIIRLEDDTSWIDELLKLEGNR